MKINVGCGKQTWDGWFCIDAEKHEKATRDPDLLYVFEFNADGSLMQPIPLESEVASEIHSYHFIEHVFAWEAQAVIAEFRRLLKPGGLLVIECPNIKLAAENLLGGMPDQWCMWPFYGDPGQKNPYMTHKWGYTQKTLKRLLMDAGFNTVSNLPPQTHGAKMNRDMRAEARK